MELKQEEKSRVKNIQPLLISVKKLSQISDRKSKLLFFMVTCCTCICHFIIIIAKEFIPASRSQINLPYLRNFPPKMHVSLKFKIMAWPVSLNGELKGRSTEVEQGLD